MCRLRALLKSFTRQDQGNIAILSAVVMPVAIGALALAVDMGSLYIERREAQGAVDLAALAAAADLERADAAVHATLHANGITATRALSVIKGNYDPDPLVPVADRFRPGAFPTNAVEVEFTKPGRVYFASVFLDRPVEMGVKAVAASASVATFSIGSRLAAVRAGLINGLLSALLGGNVNLSAMDYEALIAADVTLLDFMQALATELSLRGATFDEVLNASMTAGNVMKAAAAANSNNTSASVVLRELAAQAGSESLDFPLSRLINLGPFGSASIDQPSPGLDASINSMDMVTGTAALANGTNQASLSLGTSIPGLASLKVDLALGERAQQTPWVNVGQTGASVYTAQTRLRMIAEVGGVGLLSGTRLRLPIAVDLAHAKGTLAEVSCDAGNPDTAKAKIHARPGVGRAWIGELSTSQLTQAGTEPTVSAAQIVNSSGVKVTGRAHVDATNTSDDVLTFTQSDVAAGAIKRVESRQVGQTLVTSLLGDLRLDVQVLGVGIGAPGGIAQLVANTLSSVAAPLDNIVSSLLTTLGVHIGEADVRVQGIRCGTAVLAG